MNSSVIKVILLFFLSFLISTFSYSWEIFTDKTTGFQIEFPGTPEKQYQKTGSSIARVYSYEETINDKLILYQVSSNAKSNGTPYRFKESDINIALKNFIIGNLMVYGVNQENIKFTIIPKFKDKYPAIYYYTNALPEGIIAEGISCLIDGKHYKIGVMYEPSLKNEAKNNLNYFLNSISQK